MSKPSEHTRRTAKFAKKLKHKDIYEWIMANGYYPESYVLPPCFNVTRYPAFGKKYFPLAQEARIPLKVQIWHKSTFQKAIWLIEHSALLTQKFIVTLLMKLPITGTRYSR